MSKPQCLSDAILRGCEMSEYTTQFFVEDDSHISTCALGAATLALVHDVIEMPYTTDDGIEFLSAESPNFDVVLRHRPKLSTEEKFRYGSEGRDMALEDLIPVWNDSGDFTREQIAQKVAEIEHELGIITLISEDENIQEPIHAREQEVELTYAKN